VVIGIFTGLLLSIILIVLSPTVMSDPIFSLNNPGIVSIPAGFAVTIGISLLDGRKEANKTT
jgi:cation/acetate symporter